ncbi:MAG: CRISPR-associated protein Csm7 [Magnetococcales bacterium]|nr:CRISPR-associated protein Csm7 [Magnetococcales bacterium]MBF0321534.1 CRISPR-associated protein Csm7 [Magnetococcales bacterium]
METLRVTLKPQTAFATPLHGDTLFGQLCWILRNNLGELGEDWLNELLTGYTQGNPFLVVSDIFPAGFIPRPQLPSGFFPGQEEKIEGRDRKADKKRTWMPWKACEEPLPAWITTCKSDKEIWPADPETVKSGKSHMAGRVVQPQPRNAINRLTGTTGADGFAPYAVEQTWFPPTARLELWLLFDPKRLPREDLAKALFAVGQTGFGKDANVGLGKFLVEDVGVASLPTQKESNAWLTLGFCAPQGGGFNPERSFYQVFTRFGRHGDVAALTGQVYKNPILLARAGAVLVPADPFDPGRRFVGQGLGGDNSLSSAIPGTVHQGYCPVVGIRLLEENRS